MNKKDERGKFINTIFTCITLYTNHSRGGFVYVALRDTNMAAPSADTNNFPKIIFAITLF